MEKSAEYGISVRLQAPYEEAVEKATAALKAEGFGVLTEIDVRAKLKEKLGVDFRKHIILGACNPPLAHKALQAELDIGLLLPCNVVVYEEDGGSVVSAIDPIAAMSVVGNEGLRELAQEVAGKLQRVIESLSP